MVSKASPEDIRFFHSRKVKRAKLEDVVYELSRLKGGEVVYHTGFLTLDAPMENCPYHTAGVIETKKVRSYAARGEASGLWTLAQRKLAPYTYEYIAQVRSVKKLVTQN